MTTHDGMLEAAGDRWQLRFVRTTGQFKAGETVEVVEPVGKQLRVRGASGREQLLAPSRAPSSFPDCCVAP